jgi:hypothetical protein
MNKEDVKLYSWIIRGSQRISIIKVMDRPLTPTQIKKLTGLPLNNVSDNLRLFVEKKLSKCLNEEETLGRIYELTDKGNQIKKLILSSK